MTLPTISLEHEKHIISKLNKLLRIVHKQFTHGSSGLCCSIARCWTLTPWPTTHERLDVEYALDLCRIYWKEWPKYSRSRNYPVPGPEGYTAIKAFASLPHRKGEYGANRKELLNFLIKCTEYHLESLK